MMRVMIVDDERITCQWIKKKIEKLGSDYLVTGEFANGRQALEYCRNHEVDVIFTDICMSGMDGMEFLKNVQELGKSPYTVILSAYDEFQYARQALKLGVHEFVLKPEITGEELKRILEEARKYLSGQKNDKRNREQQEEILRYLVGTAGSMSEEKLCEMIKDNHIELEERNLVVINIFFEKPEMLEKVSEIFELYMEEKHLTGQCFSSALHECTIIYNHRNDLVRHEVAGELQQILQIHLGETLFMGISCRGDGFLQIADLYRQASQAGKNRMFFEIPGCMGYDEIRVAAEDGTDELYCSRDIREIIELIEKERYSEADGKIEFLLEKLKSAVFLPPQYVKTVCNEIMTAYIHRLWKYSLNGEEQRHVENIGLMTGENCVTCRDLYQKIYREQQYLSALLQSKWETKRYSGPIQEVMDYVELHYDEKILMEDIAAKVHLSRTYLSVLFKKETGEKFSDYLQRIRLENSSVLLRDTKLSMQEIAEKTGFFDLAHFSRAFKDNYKCSPSEYRKQNNTKKY